MGQLDLAEKYFIRLLEQLSPDDRFRGDLYEDLANLAAQAKDYNKSVRWRKKALKFRQEHPSESSITTNPSQHKIDSVKANTEEMYQLHDITTPRYFFILPTRQCDEMLINDEQNWFRIHYKLYFLCECSHEPNEMHVAPHEDIVRILLSCGRFILLRNDGTSQLKFNNPAEKEIIKQQLKLIETLINKFDNTRTRPGSSITDLQKSRGTSLQEEELRELETYLQVVDNKCTLGNLYRTITVNGQVLWVCTKHYDLVSFNNEMRKYIKAFLDIG
ncbi:unnamed protein product, partial [Rotaria sp. Silwood1]